MTRLIAAVAVLAALVFAAQVNAHEITFNGLSYKMNVQIQHDRSSLYVQAGAYLIEIDHEGVNRTAFCVDLDNWIKSQWQATFVPVTTVNGGLAAAYLYDHFAGSVSSNLAAAGLQVAIWEVVDDYGSGLDLSAGRFRLSGSNDVRNAAAGYLSALPADLSRYSTSSFVILSGDSPRSQNLIVPEAGTLGLLSSLVLPLLIRRRP